MKKIMSITAVILLVFLSLLLIILNTGVLNDLIKSLIIDTAQKSLLNCQLNIGSISGKPSSGYTIEDILLKHNNADFLIVDTFKISYNFGQILKKKITIEEILLESPVINLKQKGEIWNFTEIMPESNKESETKETSGSKFDWEILLKEFHLNNFQVFIDSDSQNELIPEQVNLSFLVSSEIREKINLEVKDFELKTFSPDFQIKQVNSEVELFDNNLLVKNFRLKTINNEIDLTASVKQDNLENSQISISALNFDLNEFDFLLSDLPLKKIPVINLTTQLERSALKLNLDIVEDESSISIDAQTENIFSDPSFNADLSISNFTIKDWLEIPVSFENLDADLLISGSGKELPTLNADIVMHVYSGFLNEKNISGLDFLLNKITDSAKIMIDFNNEPGSIALSANVDDIFKNRHFSIRGEISDFDYAMLLGKQEKSAVNLSLDISGQFPDLENHNSEAKIIISDSFYENWNLEKLQIDATTKGNEIKNLLLSLESDYANLKLSGYGTKEELTIEYSLKSGDFSEIAQELGLSDLFVEAQASGKAIGNLEDLRFNTIVNLNSFKMDKMFFDSAELELILNKKSHEIDFTVETNAADIFINPLMVNNLNVSASGNLNSMQSRISASNDSIGFILESFINKKDDSFEILLGDISLNWNNYNITGGSDSTCVLISKDRYQIDDLLLCSDSSKVYVNGEINPNGTQNLLLEIINLEISQVADILNKPEIGKGVVNLTADVSGYLNKPEIEIDLSINDGQISGFDYTDVNVVFTLDHNELKSEFSALIENGNQIKGNSTIPIIFPESTKSFSLPTPDKNRNLYFELETDTLNISFLKDKISGITTLEGLFKLGIKATSTFDDPLITGSVVLENGKVEMPEYGIKYDNITLLSHFAENSFILDRFEFIRDKGKAAIHGKVNFKDNILDGIEDYSIDLNMVQLQLSNKREHSIMLDVDFNLSGQINNSVYRGSISIPQSRFDISKFQKSNDVVDPNEPLLVKAFGKENADKFTEREQINLTSKFISGLKGKLVVDIPKNTWIRSPEMNIEVSSNVEIIKTGKFFELFGEVKTLRGYYELYGKKFVIKNGSIIFSGGEIPDPYLDISISHTFRDASRNKRTLDIYITERAMSPKLSFEIDEVEIPETDAISYLLFGRSSSDISQGEKSQVNDETGNLDFAKNIIAKQLTGQITNKIGKALNLDVIEFSGFENLKQATVLIGKYITNDLFLSYEKEFSLSQSKEIIPEKISLEYEINKYFIIEATKGDEKSTGVDIYFKIEK
ncbi:MAG: translocation/assembly module TamB domain-containing protein [Candidatus Cloacimonetes bacterium]|nr:translocation/assembly module TamB domain-containing protein [Candidatus Cloacimonadota bacterium]